jgi:daunorubicin/doxorubicin transport system ATP-binding protein
MPDQLAIETTQLVKTFGSLVAVDEVDLTVPAGSVYGILGPNGAGKTTAIRILATLLRPDRGRACVLGHDVVSEADAVRSRISLTGQGASIDEDLTGIENLVLIGLLLGLSRAQARARAAELLDSFDLAPAGGRLVKSWSGGMRRRIDLAASIVARPDLLFLDEPSTGLDPRSRIHIWDVIRGLVGAGTTVLLTTQYLEEADQLADRVAVFDHGRVVAEGTPAALKAAAGAGVLRLRLADVGERERAKRLLVEALGTPVNVAADPKELTAAVPDPARAANAVASLTRSGISVDDFALSQPSLDEVFLALTTRPNSKEAP